MDSDEERIVALCVSFGMKRREWGMVFARPLAQFDELSRTAKRKLRACLEFRRLAGLESA